MDASVGFENKKSLSLDFILSSFLILGVVQAFSSNILKIDFPLVQLSAIVVSFWLLPSLYRLPVSNFFVLFFAISLMVFLCISALLVKVELWQELIYQLSACFLFFFFVLFFNGYGLTVSVGNGVPWFTFWVLIYFFASLFIYFLFWEQVASVFYSKDNNFGGLLMDGRIRRMYGLLYNPLASAFSALLFMLALHMFGVRARIANFLLFWTVVLAFSRSAILLLLVFCFYTSVLNRSRLFIIVLCIFLSVLVVAFSPWLALMVERALLDETGSIREHLKNYQIGISSVLSIYGEGFVDARNYGAWNIRLESMPFQYAFVGGGGAFFVIFMLLLMCYYNLFRRFGSWRCFPLLLVFPLLFSFPLHTFNLPILMFSFLLCAWIPRIRYT